MQNYPGEGRSIFVDTPGIHRPLHRMNVRMVDAALDTLREVDVLVPRRGRRRAAGQGRPLRARPPLGGARAGRPRRSNKIDLVKKPRLLPLIERYSREHEFAEIVPLSAATGDGVDRLERALLARLPEGEPLYPDDYLTDQPERFFAAEIVREKLLQHTRDELPFTSAVVVDQFEEAGEGGLLRLYCTILVERESQKPIVIGRRGDMIKRIGTEARADLERFFRTRVFLDLHVKVRARLARRRPAARGPGDPRAALTRASSAADPARGPFPAGSSQIPVVN